MSVSIEEIKRLKELTGVGLTDAEKALTEVDGDFDKALEAMRKKGLTKAEKKGEREARQGVVDTYLHSGRIGVVIEVNCETDFVARTDDFKNFVHDVAMHVAAASPEYISIEDVPESEKKAKEAEFTEKVKSEGKPENMIEQIVTGMVKKYFAEKCLLDQPFIKNPDQTIGDLLKESIAKLGENMVIRRFQIYDIKGSGAFATYIHSTGKIGVLFEVGTDNAAAAANEATQTFAKYVAMHVAAANPQVVSGEEFSK